MFTVRSSKQALLAVGLIASLSACAHSVKKADYPVTANGADEIAALEQQMTAAQKDQVDVLAPKNFSKARESLTGAKEALQKNKDNADVLEELGYAKAYLNEALAASSRGQNAIPEVLQARTDAKNAKAPELYGSEFRKADRALEDVTEDFEKGDMKLSVEDRNELQRKYLDVELMAIKKSRLGEAQAMIEGAKDMGAKRLSPQTLTDAEAKYKNAENVIAASRHEEDKIAPAVSEATLAAKQLVAVTETAKNSKGKSPEEIALEIERSSKRISEAASANAELAAENSELSSKERFNAALEKARESFTSDEAEAYRQGDQLLIRLKRIQFPVGRTELPKQSFKTLAKVKDVIGELGAEKVVVEGHTDSVGNRTVNQRLSEERAKAVADYLVSEKALDGGKIETKGYGFDKPLNSNKTKADRAQNRRVDILITPET